MGMGMGEELPKRRRLTGVQPGVDVRFSQACKDPVRHKSEATDGDLAVVTAVSSLFQGESGHFFR